MCILVGLGVGERRLRFRRGDLDLLLERALTLFTSPRTGDGFLFSFSLASSLDFSFSLGFSLDSGSLTFLSRLRPATLLEDLEDLIYVDKSICSD